MASAAELRAHRDVLTAFERDYREYVEAQKHAYTGGSGSQTWLNERRASLLRRAARADRAMQAAGPQIVITPPPAFGGPILRTLPSQIFAHETSLFGSGEPFLTADMVLDGLGHALGYLDDKIEQAERKTRKPIQGPEPSVMSPMDFARTVNLERSALPRAGTRLTLWGHLRKVPPALGTVADFATVGGLVIGALKLLGVF